MLDPMVAYFLPWRIDGLTCILVVAVIAFLATCTRRSSRQCRRCKEINRPYARFCAHCGQRLG